MLDEKTYDTAEAKLKLKSPEFLRTQPPANQAFYEAVADRLDGDIVPTGIVMCVLLLLEDMKTGVNGFTGKPLPKKLTDLVSKEAMGPHAAIMYNMYLMTTPRMLAKLIGGDECVAAVEKFQAELNHRPTIWDRLSEPDPV